jgi:hypothetical protein
VTNEIKVLKNAALNFVRSQGLLPTPPHSQAMRARWATPEHRAKIDAANERRLADPVELAAMRARLDANRITGREQMSASISEAYWRKHGWGGFPTNEALSEWIVAQYMAGLSAREIAAAVCMSHNAVTRRLRLADLDVPDHGAGRHHAAKSAAHLAQHGIHDLRTFDQEVAALYREGRSVYALSLAYGIGGQAIRTSLYRSGIILRGKGGRPSKIPRFRGSRK